MRWFMRVAVLVVLMGLGVVGACGTEGSPCGECPATHLCNAETKKCVKRNTCVACSSSAECENAESCVDGCCQATGVARESADTESLPDSPADASVTPENTTPPESSCPEPPCSTSCKTNTDCTDPSKPVCDLFQNICVQCFQQSDCTQGVCVNGTCGPAEDKCKGVTCPTEKVCDPATGDCVGLCPDKPCAADRCCNEKGQCVACGTKQACEACTDHPECGKQQRCAGLGSGGKACVPTCPDDKCPDDFSCLSLGSKLGKLCIPNAECKAVDRCQGVTCNDGKKCCPATGQCQFCCTDQECPVGQKCLASGSTHRCGADPKACQPACQTGEICDPKTGKCQKNCASTGCTDSKTVCDPGSGLCVPKDCRSNWTCPTGTVCNATTGQCGQETDCRKKASLCNSPQCCSQSTGKCVSDCRQCGSICPVSGQVCNQTTGRCETPACTMRSPCRSNSDCCGGKCEFSVGNLKELCTCKRDSDCGPGYRCKSSLLNKYCEK